ncbi:uncharacterized protein LOC110987046 [Acanthaster planci]|uniref:Uncharacterized protein LOC110987046 n=1 Tax=Acanthaster planci TaxID=133434 RepID=A0A8B7ZJU0_ACAPL|nr:uncharacterized protein LOC110987046 [Acanthaster planci]
MICTPAGDDILDLGEWRTCKAYRLVKNTCGTINVYHPFSTTVCYVFLVKGSLLENLAERNTSTGRFLAAVLIYSLNYQGARQDTVYTDLVGYCWIKGDEV